jgi:hypothetical protein
LQQEVKEDLEVAKKNQPGDGRRRQSLVRGKTDDRGLRLAALQQNIKVVDLSNDPNEAGASPIKEQDLPPEETKRMDKIPTLKIPNADPSGDNSGKSSSRKRSNKSKRVKESTPVGSGYEVSSIKGAVR